jgi:hypothetical protein
MKIPKDFLDKEFLSQFKTGEDVSIFLKSLHAQMYEELLKNEIDFHLGYEKHSK